MSEVDLTPGPELDLYLTKQLLGCSWYAPGHYAQAADGAQTGWHLPDHSFLAYKFEPSRSFPDAWRMVMLLVQRDHGFILISPTKTCDVWTARFDVVGRTVATGTEKTPEGAIAAAARMLNP